MKTLFSPIGTADPLTMLGDGPMLNIVRHHRPDKVVLFLSPDMTTFQEQNQLYTRAISMLCNELGRPCPEIQLVSSDHAEVYEFDHYIGEFEAILDSLSSEEGFEQLLVNVSSGTPAMEQALVAIGSFGRHNVTLMQVTTPRAGINKRSDRENPEDFDFETMWEFLLENPDGQTDRTRIVHTPNFSNRLLRENVITFVKQYEYDSALELLNQMTDSSSEALELVRASSGRLNLDSKAAGKVFTSGELAYRSDKLVEYIWVMEVRLKQGHYAEFVRSMTPALTALMKRCLSAANLPETCYLKRRKNKFTSEIDYSVVDLDARLSSILNPDGLARSRFITNQMLMSLVHEYVEDDATVSLVQKLRDFEGQCRNPLSHELNKTDETELERLGGMPLDSVLNSIFRLYKACGGSIQPGLYDRINDHILSSL